VPTLGCGTRWPDVIIGVPRVLAWIPVAPALFANPGGIQPFEPGVHPQPIFSPRLHPGGVDPLCFQSAFPWLNPPGIPLRFAKLRWCARVLVVRTGRKLRDRANVVGRTDLPIATTGRVDRLGFPKVERLLRTGWLKRFELRRLPKWLP